MGEPLYEYKKGVGWHLVKPGVPGVLLKLKDCTVRLEDRAPMENEFYLAFGANDTYWIKEDGTLNYQRMLDGWQDRHYIRDFNFLGTRDIGNGYRTVVLVVL